MGKCVKSAWLVLLLLSVNQQNIVSSRLAPPQTDIKLADSHPTPLKSFRKFGSTGLTLNILGLGTAKLPEDDKKFYSAIDKANTLIINNAGVVLIDTTRSDGDAEELTGNYFKIPKNSNLLVKTFICAKWSANNDLQDLVLSVSRSANLMGKINLLYIDIKGSAGILEDSIIKNNIIQMKSINYLGISYLGASISEEGILEHAVNKNLISWLDVIQIPADIALRRKDLLEKIYAMGKAIVVNFPVLSTQKICGTPKEAFERLIKIPEISVILNDDMNSLEENADYIRNVLEKNTEEKQIEGIKKLAETDILKTKDPYNTAYSLLCYLQDKNPRIESAALETILATDMHKLMKIDRFLACNILMRLHKMPHLKLNKHALRSL